MTYYGQDEEPILELIFDSAIDLPKALLSLKASPYVMAAIVSPESKPNWVKTCIDEKGGENPVWDYVIRFPLNQQKLHMARNFNLICKIMHSGTALGDRKIGHVKIRLLVLLAGDAAGENIAYPVVSDGEERGRIVISHKLVGGVPAPAPPPMAMGVQDPNQNPSLEFLNTTHSPSSQDHIPFPFPYLELVFHRRIDLAHPSFTHKGRPYIMAAIVGRDTKPNWVKTVTDEEGGENPVWDYMIQIPLNQEKVRMARNFKLICKIMHFGNKLGHREIGQVKVSLQAFLAGTATGENITYPVVVSGGVEKGKIVISHKLVTNTVGTGEDVAAPPPADIQDPNTAAAVDRMRLAASVTTIAAVVYDAFAG